jgi:peptide/nickel transport system permease protein
MTTKSKRAVIAAVRKAVFAGIVLLVAWMVLLGLRGTISADTINLMRQEMQQEATEPQEIPYNPWDWDWSKSLWTSEPVSGIVNERLWPTLGYIGLTALFSLVLALLFLFIGRLISKATRKPGWLAKTRVVLRLLVISIAISAPIFAWETLAAVYPWLWWGLDQHSPLVFVIAAFSASALPAWLLVQHGHSEMAKRPKTQAIFDGALWRHLVISMFVKILKLIGAIIIIGIFVVLSSSLSGMSRTLIDAVNRRDFPIIFGITWTFIVIVVLVKLAAELIEIMNNYFSHRERKEEPAAVTTAGLRVPRWLLIICLVLVAVSVIIAVAAPLIATHGYNEMTLADRLTGPSSKYILGTDNLGRDVFSRMLFAIREDIFLGFIAVGIVIVLAAGWGILGAHLRKANDWQGDTLADLVMLPRDVLCACPWLILLLLFVSIVGMQTTGFITISLVLLVSLTLLPRAAEIVQEAYYFAPPGRGWLDRVLAALPVIVLFSVAGGILYISATSYLGFGVPPPIPELGSMLSGPARRYMLQVPWMALWPSITLVSLITVWVMTGNALLERLGFRTRDMWSKIWE